MKLFPAFTIRKVDRYFIMVGVCGLAAAAGLLVVIMMLFGKILVLDHELRVAAEKWQQYENGTRNYPSSERQAYLQQQLRRLREFVVQLRQFPIFNEPLIAQDAAMRSPLKFKEELFRVKSQLRQAAKKVNSSIPESIGFDKWENRLPAVADLDMLFEGLLFVDNVASLALAAEVTAIDNIQLDPPQSVRYVASAAEPVYTERSLTFVCSGPFAAIIEVLNAIDKAPEMYSVAYLKMYATPETKDKKARAAKKGTIPDGGTMRITAEMKIIKTAL